MYFIEQQTHYLWYQDLLYIIHQVLPKLKTTKPTKKKRSLHSYSGSGQAVFTECQRVQTNAYVGIKCAFPPIPNNSVGGYIFPWTNHVWMMPSGCTYTEIHTCTSSKNCTSWMSIYSPINSFSPSPHKCIMVLQWRKDWPPMKYLENAITPTTYSHWTNYKRSARFKQLFGSCERCWKLTFPWRS